MEAWDRGDLIAMATGPSVSHSMLLSCVAASGTAIGGLIILIFPDLQFKQLGYLAVSCERLGGAGGEEERDAKRETTTTTSARRRIDPTRPD